MKSIVIWFNSFFKRTGVVESSPEVVRQKNANASEALLTEKADVVLLLEYGPEASFWYPFGA